MRYEQYCSIVDLIEKSINKNQDRIAIIENNISYTYNELYEMIELAANILIREGLHRKSIILYVDKSVEFIALVIAIWKTGGTYIPIDTEMPKGRVEYIIENSNASCIIVNEYSKYSFDKKQICIHNFFVNIDTDFVKQNYPKIINNDIAYIIYTSGSTGTPKGVQITNDNLVYFMLTMSKYIKLSCEDRWLSITTVCFDISIFEMFFPIINGIVLVIGKKRLLIDMKMLRKTINEEKITIMQATPITWELLVESDKKILHNIKVLCGGDKLKQNLAKLLYENAIEVWNLYGPTETTIWSSLNKLQSSEDISIGNPIEGTKFYLFDDEMNLNDKEGELYIGGLGVSKGYLNNSELNKKRYIGNPLNKDEIIYQTGDYVENIQGKYYCIGRTDFQIKINGHRIEIEDIEKNILSIKGVCNAVVVPDITTNNIFAFVETNNTNIDELYIKENLRKKINGYMVPKKIIIIDKIPITFNNKIDRKTLIDKYVTSLGKNEVNNYCLEDKIKFIWEKNIGEKVDVSKSYKEYSIDSLTITQISIEMEKIWNDFSINEIIKYETISNIIKNRKIYNLKDYSKDERLNLLLKKHNLTMDDIKIEQLTDIEKMMANVYFVNSKLNYFQDCYIFKVNRNIIDIKNIEKVYKEELSKIKSLYCKYIFGRNFKVVSKTFNYLIEYREITINSIDILNKTINMDIDEIVDINKIAIRLKVIFFKKNIFFLFKYPHVRMDEVSFFKLINPIFKRIVKNNLIISVEKNIDLIKNSNVLRIILDESRKEKCIKEATYYKTNLNNIIEFYILKALQIQYHINKINYVLNNRNFFGNTITICSIKSSNVYTINEYVSLKNRLEDKTDNDILISYNDISNNLIGKEYLDFEHVEKNGYNINIEIYNKENSIYIIISSKENLNIDLKVLESDILNLVKGKRRK